MPQKTTLGIVGAIWLALVLSCTLPKKEPRLEQSQNTASNSAVSSKPISELDRVLAISADFKPSYKILGIRDVSTGVASRFVVDISLPKDSTKDVIENNLRYAAKAQYEKTKPDAIQVFGYPEGRSIDSSNSVGSLEFAPFGDWGRAGEKPSLDKYKAVFKYKELLNRDVSEDNEEMKKALVGDYQAQRNVAYSYLTGADGHSQNVVTGCAWYMVILKSKHSQMDSSDTNNKRVYCDQNLDSKQLRQAEVEADTLLKKIKPQK